MSRNERLSDLVPTNWCDPLLTGPGSIGQPPYDCGDIENLLQDIKKRIQVAEAGRRDAVPEWQTMESCPINTEVLLWNQETGEMFFGQKPEDAPSEDSVVVFGGLPTAAYADAWQPKPAEPETESAEEGGANLSIVPAMLTAAQQEKSDD